ncbi:hypothetical protein BDV96DRAFT_463408, partial [Lophiotrema nucula]
EWGKVVINVEKLTGISKVRLQHVAYIPGFFTNLVLLSRCRTMGLHFNSGRDCLYKRQYKNIFYILQFDNSYWIMD